MTDPSVSPEPAVPSNGPVDAPPPGYFGVPSAPGNPQMTGPYMPTPGTPGAAGYPYPYYAGGQPNPYGFNPNAKTNGMAISSLILGITGFLFLPACVGIGLGFGALSTINRTGQPGRGMAIAGIITSGIWLALWVLLLILG